MANENINYAKKIDDLLKDMPDFASDFIYNFGKPDKYTTKYQYAYDLKDFLSFMVNFLPEYSEKEMKEITLEDLDKVKPLDINRYLTLLSGDNEKGLKETTVQRRRATLSSMFRFLVSNEKIKANPVLATKTIDIPEKDLIYLTDEEQELFLKTVLSGAGLSEKSAKVHNRYVDRDIAMFLLLLDTGLRVSEMLSTNICDYDLEKGSVRVKRKGGDIDKVYYSDECASYLDDYFSAQRVKYELEDVYIPAFTTTTGQRLGVRAVETLVKKYVKLCMPDKEKLISPHKLRSSFAMSFYAESDKDILLLKKKLHHKSIRTTTVYSKASDMESKESRNILSNRRNRLKKDEN